MQDIRWKAFWHFFFYVLFCCIIWLANDLVTALIFLSLGLFCYLCYHVYWLQRLNAWLHKPIPSKIPAGNGMWEQILTLLRKEQRRHARSQTQANAALGRFTHAASALPDGVVVLNSQNNIQWCNNPAERKLGLNLAKDVNKPINYLVRHKDFLNYLNRNDFSQSIKLKSWLNQDILEFQIIDYGTRQKLLICRDVTQLEKIDVMRRDFIANVSHELRTPLTVVGGFLETLQDMEGAIPDDTRSYFEIMQDQTIRMKILIDDLLVLSQIESNVQAPEDVEINMMNLLGMLVSDAKGLSQNKHNIVTDFTPNLNINGALREIQSALSNLVSNAIRYSPDGGEIKIRWFKENGFAIFSIQDHGIGIDGADIERITERFYRVDKGRSRLTGGTGLGLSIVKHILTRHQAKLRIESKIGYGSTFSVQFPITRVIMQ